MQLIRLQDNTPAIYSSASRDFQLLERLYDAVLNGTRYNIYSMLGVIDSVHCRASLLPLLRSAVGFLSTAEYPDRVLRTLIIAFPSLIRQKGSIGCVITATKVYLKAYGISGDVDAIYDREEGEMQITIQSSPVDIISLSSFIRFFVPPGLKLRIAITKPSAISTVTGVSESGIIATIGNKHGATVRGTEDIKITGKTVTKYVDKYISAVGSGVVSANSGGDEFGKYQEESING